MMMGSNLIYKSKRLLKKTGACSCTCPYVTVAFYQSRLRILGSYSKHLVYQKSHLPWKTIALLRGCNDKMFNEDVQVDHHDSIGVWWGLQVPFFKTYAADSFVFLIPTQEVPNIDSISRNDSEHFYHSVWISSLIKFEFRSLAT